MNKKTYSGDSARIVIKGLVPTPTPVPYGTKVQGGYFDGYPQIVKERGSQPTYEVKTEKDIMVAMRDGVRIAVDVHRPNAEGTRFTACLLYTSDAADE